MSPLDRQVTGLALGEPRTERAGLPDREGLAEPHKKVYLMVWLALP
jgi:hypothetical protein